MQCPAKLKTLPNTITTTTTTDMKQDYLPSRSPMPDFKVLVPNEKLLFNQIPTDYPKPGETTRIDKSEKVDLTAPLNGGVLVKTIALSIDPYLRGRMRPEDVDTYSPAFAIGKPISNFGIAAVIRSEIRKFRPGDHVYGVFDFQNYSIINPKDASELKPIKKEESLPWSTYLGVLGMPGQTAYVGWKKFLPTMNKKDSDNIKTVIFVSSAAGGVGSMVVQLAKAQGLTIIGSAGSEEKVQFAKELGAHIAFNYKTTDTATALKESGLHIDIYWDNVGGEIFDAVLPAMNNHGRIIMCGAIAGYNTPNKYGIKNMHEVVSKRLTIQGFIVNDSLKDHISEFFKTFPKMAAGGKLKHKEQLYFGFDGAEQAITDIQKGENAAKPVVMLDEEKEPDAAQV